MGGLIRPYLADPIFMLAGLSFAGLTCLPLTCMAGDGNDALAGWRKGVKISPVLPEEERHTVHTYYTASPESPDGRWVLLYTSTARNGDKGEIWVVERATGQRKVLARNVTVEDIHRAACQQWVSGGRRVVFHDCRDATWVVVCVDVDTLKERVLAAGRQVGWGQPGSNIVPLYGPHWAPGEHRHLEILNVESGEIRTVLTAEAVRAAYPEWISETFDEKPVSIFFPVLSPDLSRVVFKMAAPKGGMFQSLRQGLICYDLNASRLIFMVKTWGHPGWCPDSRTIMDVWARQITLLDSNTGKASTVKGLPSFRGAHPCAAPGGRLFATDLSNADAFGGVKGHWGVGVGDLRTGEFIQLDHFENAHGATSWRTSHPHPSFSPDGKRLYYNVSATRWTRLYVAEAGE